MKTHIQADPAPPFGGIVIRLAACIYFADMETQKRDSVLWDMLSNSKQSWYVQAANQVLRDAARKDLKTVATPTFQKKRRGRPPLAAARSLSA